MFSQDDDSEQRVALFVVFGVVTLVVASVLVFSVQRGGSSSDTPMAGTPAAVAASLGALLPLPAPPNAGLAQAASDAASIKVEQGVVKFYFASGKADLAAGAGAAMDDLVRGAQTGRKVMISGFHDATGGAAQNTELAKRRALVVRTALMAAGLAESQIDLEKPEPVVDSGSDAEARRVEISLQ